MEKQREIPEVGPEELKEMVQTMDKNQSIIIQFGEREEEGKEVKIYEGT